jgi:hypothetical protein
MIKLFIVVFLLMSVPAQAEITNRQHHDIHHITGSCIGTAYLNHAGYSWGKSAVIMLLFGTAWEVMDQIAYEAKWKNPVFDYYRGGEWQDVARNMVGITLSFPIRR